MDKPPDFDPAPDDPEIAALLDFPSVVRKNKRHDGWSPLHQRGFIAWLALTGNVDKSAQAVGRTQSGAWGVRNAMGGAGFADAWEAAHVKRGKEPCLGARGDDREAAGLAIVARDLRDDLRRGDAERTCEARAGANGGPRTSGLHGVR